MTRSLRRPPQPSLRSRLVLLLPHYIPIAAKAVSLHQSLPSTSLQASARHVSRLPVSQRSFAAKRLRPRRLQQSLQLVPPHLRSFAAQNPDVQNVAARLVRLLPGFQSECLTTMRGILLQTLNSWITPAASGNLRPSQRARWIGVRGYFLKSNITVTVTRMKTSIFQKVQRAKKVYPP